jgi:hypothetical protein
MEAREQQIPFQYEGESSLQRWILTSVGNLPDCFPDCVLINKPGPLSFQGSMCHVPGPKATTEARENDPQTIWVLT